MTLQEGEREGNLGVKEASPILGEKPCFPFLCHSPPPGSASPGSQDKFQAGAQPCLDADTHSHLWYLWLFLECPGVGRGLREDELSQLGVPLQWGCGVATLGEAVPLSQNGRQQWRQN